MEFVVKVTRTIYPPAQPANVVDQFGNSWRMHLSDDVRHQMGGERIVFFNAKRKDGKLIINNRVPAENW